MSTTLRTATGAADGDPDAPLAELRRIREQRRQLTRAEAEQVRRARGQGYSWLEIASALDITKQAAHKRFGKR